MLYEVSATSMDTYLRCPRQYYFRYVLGIRTPPSGAMVQGFKVHDAAERNYKHKARTRQDLPLDEQTDYFVERWQEETKKGELVYDKEKDETPASMEKQGILLVKEFQTQIAPKVDPLSEKAVEEWFEVTLVSKSGDQYLIKGKIDVTDEKNVIRDLKCVSIKRKPAQNDVDSDLQLSTYAFYRWLKKQPFTLVAKDAIVKSDPPQALKPVVSYRSEEMLRDHKNQIGHIAKGIAHEVFPKNTKGWWCNSRWCNYWSRCEGKQRAIIDLARNQNIEQQLKDSMTAGA